MQQEEREVAAAPRHRSQKLRPEGRGLRAEAKSKPRDDEQLPERVNGPDTCIIARMARQIREGRHLRAPVHVFLRSGISAEVCE